MSKAAVWQRADVTQQYLTGVRGAIPLASQQIDVMLRLMEASGPVHHTIDLGCGDGVLAEAVLRRFPGSRCDLADFSLPMLDAARARFEGWPEATFRFHCIDYANPGWVERFAEDAPYDAIFSGYSIHHQPDAVKKVMYAGVHSLLRPGGLFVNIEHVASPTAWVEAQHDNLFIDHLHTLDRAQPRASVAAAYHSRPDKEANLLSPVECQCQWLCGIGYTDVDCYVKCFELAVFGGRKAT
jgi:ubiquinone/menaquinone biosynthesis C-methylase UbiE